MTHRLLALGVGATLLAAATPVAAGYVRSGALHFARTAPRRGVAYDYNVPLAFPPYGYTPGFWGYGGKRYYDKFGNYTKYQEGTPRGGAGPIETVPRSRLR